MSATKRATVYLESDLHREDAEDLRAFRQRSKEPALSFEKVVSDLKRRGRL